MNGCKERGVIVPDNVVIRWYKMDEIDAVINMLVHGADGELREVIYENAFYSQLGEDLKGMMILRTRNISLAEFLSDKHQKSAVRYAEDYHDKDYSKLKEMMGRGFKLFMHYMEYDALCVVLADRMTLSV